MEWEPGSFFTRNKVAKHIKETDPQEIKDIYYLTSEKA